MAYLYPTNAPRVLAHRGLALAANGDLLDENTIPAFRRAVEAGATHIESDIQVTADGVPVLFHDNTLLRVAGIDRAINQIDMAEVKQIKLMHGGTIPTLESALQEVPHALFNLDFKSEEAPKAGAAVILEQKAQERILVASFSESRRSAAAMLLPESATSASGEMAALARLTSMFGHFGLKQAVSGVQALQLPTRSGPFRFDSARFISALADLGVETHFWTINDPAEMKRLVALGAAGIVTDRADLAVRALGL